MAKGLVASKAKPRWKKGHSSSSNPSVNKHRQAAKSRFFQAPGADNVPFGASSSSERKLLTESALKKHDTEYSDVAGSSLPPDADNATFRTWATNITECTNTTFNRVHQNWRNDSVHKEVLAVLAAVTDIIKTQGGEETELEYFAILMTTLEAAEDLPVISATVYLISLVIKKLPASMLNSKFDRISAVMVSLLSKYSSSEGAALTSRVVSCLTTLLRAQSPPVWKNSQVTDVYDNLLALSLHPKPKVRKAVRDSIAIIIRASDMVKQNPLVTHPAGAHTEKYLLTQIQSLLDTTLLQKSKDSAHYSNIIHTLQMLKPVIGFLPRSSIKSSCEMVLKLLSLNNVILKGVCMEVINCLFNSQPPVERLPADTNARILTAFYDYLPNTGDIQMMPAWLLVMENALINLVRVDENLGLTHLPKFVSTCLQCLMSDKIENMTAAAVSLKSILVRGVSAIDEDLLKSQVGDSASPLLKLVQMLEGTLGYQYHASWSLALQILSTLFQVLSNICPQQLSNLLPSMAGLRDNPEFGYRAELDTAIGAAIKYIKPRAVMSVIPIEVGSTGDSIKRSWLMPLLHTYTSHTELAFYVEYFMPLASKCRTIANKQKALGNSMDHTVFNTLVQQIWALLPSFCSKPTDLTTSFKSLAKTLGQLITSEAGTLRRGALSSLRKLIHSTEDDEEGKGEMAKFAKNYLPILFNIYTSEETVDFPDQSVVLDTVRDYLSITDTQLVGVFYDRCMSKLKEEEEKKASSKRSGALLDLLVSMALHVDESRLTDSSPFVQSLITSKDKNRQKKGYRFLENMCSMTSEASSLYITNHISDVQELLLTNLSTSHPSSKAPRLRCLIHIFKSLEEESRDFLVAVLPEAVLCTSEVNEAARKAAYDLIISMCEANITWRGDSELSDSILDYLSLLVAGLAGSPHMIHCTILALTWLICQYKQSLSADCLSLIANQCSTILKSKSKEIVTPALSLLKVIIGSYDVSNLSKHIQSICESLKFMKEDNRHHLRFKVKEILERLVRKFGFEMMCKLLGDSYVKQLSNIRKTLQRKKRDKERGGKDSVTAEEGEDESLFKSVKKSQPESVEEILESTDSELEEDAAEKKQSKRKPKTLPAWLRDDREEITDFLDADMSKNIMATRPKVRDPAKSKELPAVIFKTTPDGRMVITENEEEKTPNSKSTNEAELEDIDDIFEQFEMNAGKKPGKRKLISDAMSESASQVSSSTYKPGGRGIHRPLGAKKRKMDPPVHTGDEFRSKKGGGDVKRKNKMDPYAYVPLNVGTLNKRKAAKMKGQFKNLVGGAKKGAAKGVKSKGKRPRTKH